MQHMDTLSHCLARASPEIKLDVRVDYITFIFNSLNKSDHINEDMYHG